MTIFSETQAGADFHSLLDTVRSEGEVLVRSESGDVFILKSAEPKNTSPLDVPGVEVPFSTQELIDIVRDNRAGI